MVAGLRPESLPSRRAFETSPLDYLVCQLHGSLHVGIALSKPLAYLWNVLRMLDFIVALAAGFLSSPVNCRGSPSIIRTSSVSAYAGHLSQNSPALLAGISTPRPTPPDVSGISIEDVQVAFVEK
jgi:hypothetical protein